MVRCVRCGADNNGDSRFCGECGERLVMPAPLAVEPRSIAPPDGASPNGETASLITSARRPTGATREVPRPPSRSLFDVSASLTGAPAGRRAGGAAVIVLVLVDLGLAVAGALLLRAGLAGAPVVQGTPGSASGDDAGVVAMVAADAAGPDRLAAIDAAFGLPGHPDAHGTVAQPDGGAPGGLADAGAILPNLFTIDAAAAIVTPDASIPIDPYGFIDAAPAPPDAAPPPPPPDAPDPGAPPDAAVAPPADAPDDDPRTEDLANAVEKKSVASQSRFERCYADAAKAYTPDQPLAGEVDIAFRVMPTGEVQNAAAVRNDTGSTTLGDCLSAVLSAWTFPNNGLTEATVVVRPFRFSGH